MPASRDFMPKNVQSLYDGLRKGLAEAQKIFLKLHKKGRAGRTPEEQQAYEKLVKIRSTVHSAIFKLETNFGPVRQTILALTGVDIDKQ
jgi:hypothetical protein